MNALEIAIKGLVDEKFYITKTHLDDHAYLYRTKLTNAYEKRIKDIDAEIERLLTLEFSPKNHKESEAREKFVKKITTNLK